MRGIDIFALPASSRMLLLQSRSSLRSSNARIFAPAFHLTYASKATPNVRISPKISPKIVAVSKPKTNTLPRSTVPEATKLADNLPAMLANATLPTVIYESPPSKVQVTHQTVLASSLLAAAGYFTVPAIYPPPDLPWFVPLSYGFTSVCLGLFATVFYTATIARVLRITAIPVKNIGAVNQRGLNLRITAARWFPFYKKTIEVPAELVSLRKRLQDIQLPVSYVQPLDEVPALIRPFVRFGDWVKPLVYDTLSGWHTGRLIFMEIEGGKRLKLDIRGQALGGAKGFDSIIRLKAK